MKQRNLARAPRAMEFVTGALIGLSIVVAIFIMTA
jgi:hypothetical protein